MTLEKNRNTFASLFGSCLVLLEFFIFLYFTPEMTLSNLADDLFPKPHVNGFDLYSKVVVLNFYIITAITLIIIYFYFHALLWSKLSNSSDLMYYCKKASFLAILSVFFIVTFLQTTQHLEYFKALYKEFSGLPLSEKQSNLFRFPFEFAKECKKHVVGQCSAKLISDIDFEDRERFTEHRRLAYFFYPIEFRLSRPDDKPDCLIFYFKKDAIEMLPKDYDIKYQLNDENMIAVRKVK